jgi:hypothetical protein
LQKINNATNDLWKGCLLCRNTYEKVLAKKNVISMTIHTVKLYEASSLPMFLIVTCAVPTWLKASNVGTLMLIIFPGLLKLRNKCKVLHVQLYHQNKVKRNFQNCSTSKRLEIPKLIGEKWEMSTLLISMGPDYNRTIKFPIKSIIVDSK